MRLRLNPRLAARTRKRISQIVVNLPVTLGSDLSVSVNPQLTAYRGKLLSGFPDLGIAIHAAAFIRQRRIVLESALLRRPDMLRLILIHEVFHFVWVRLDNASRREFAALLRKEIRARARGELGESAAVRKATLRLRGDLHPRSKGWSDYVCESFCDTAAWFYSGNPSTLEFKLARKWANLRREWFLSKFPECSC